MARKVDIYFYIFQSVHRVCTDTSSTDRASRRTLKYNQLTMLWILTVFD
jgi:hypothetical protein